VKRGSRRRAFEKAHEKPEKAFPCLACLLACGLLMGCHSGPSFTDDGAYRAIERDAQRAEAGLAVTGADIAAGAERADSRAERVKSELDSLGAAISGSGLGDAEKGALSRQVAAAQEEAAALRYETGRLREGAARLNEQLAEEREIRAALSEEHGRREAAGAEVKEDLAATKGRLAKASGQRNLAVAIAAALALAIIGYIAFRVSRTFRVAPV
jgi:chromosome segregation ATPase